MEGILLLGGFGVFWIIGVLLTLATIGLIIYVIVDVLKKDHFSTESKLIWVIGCLVVGYIVPIIYLILDDNTRNIIKK